MRKPAAISPSQLREAARAAVATAVQARTTALSENESREISGGLIASSGPVLSGYFPTEPSSY